MLFAESVSKSFGSVDVLDGCSFTVGDRERIGLVGSNGAGKSTLLKLVASQEKPDAGGCGVRGGGSLGYLSQEADHQPDLASLRGAVDGISGGARHRPAAARDRRAHRARRG
jgi:ATPase subunit of ABC transporter with duplicated ATPase domains